jgi:hypothetical protein
MREIVKTIDKATIDKATDPNSENISRTPNRHERRAAAAQARRKTKPGKKRH